MAVPIPLLTADNALSVSTLKSFVRLPHGATDTHTVRKNFKLNARFGRDSVKFHFLMKVKKSNACHCFASSKAFAHNRRLFDLDFASITCQASCISTDGSHRLFKHSTKYECYIISIPCTLGVDFKHTQLLMIP